MNDRQREQRRNFQRQVAGLSLRGRLTLAGALITVSARQAAQMARTAAQLTLIKALSHLPEDPARPRHPHAS